MRLINTESNEPLVLFEEGKTTIYNKFLEKEMAEMGIPIPHGLRGLFEGRDAIYLHDPLFQRAFKEVYYLTAMDPSRFKWQE